MFALYIYIYIVFFEFVSTEFVSGMDPENDLEVANPWIHPCRILKEHQKITEKDQQGEKNGEIHKKRVQIVF